MDGDIILNGTTIKAINFKNAVIQDKAINEELCKISFNFYVTSDEYHDITTLLYENDFIVEVPEKKLSFQATIMNYSTSVTDLYQAGEVGLFHLELIEKLVCKKCM